MADGHSATGLCEVIRERGAHRRTITAVAGAPGSGKSTLSDDISERLNNREPGSAAVLQMDGYHFDDVVLGARGWQARKGAPHTFDVSGFAHMLQRLRANSEPEIAVPVFDRALELSRNAARIIPQSVRHLIVEGNYLFLKTDPWSVLWPHFDTTVFLDVPVCILKQRLAERWKDLSPEALAIKLEGNDYPNAELVVSASRKAEIVLSTDTDGGHPGVREQG
jgi:pantothenate kinase